MAPSLSPGFRFTGPFGMLCVSELELQAQASVPFLSRNSCPVPGLPLTAPSVRALGCIRALCVLGSPRAEILTPETSPNSPATAPTCRAHGPEHGLACSPRPCPGCFCPQRPLCDALVTSFTPSVKRVVTSALPPRKRAQGQDPGVRRTAHVPSGHRPGSLVTVSTDPWDSHPDPLTKRDFVFEDQVKLGVTPFLKPFESTSLKENKNCFVTGHERQYSKLTN